MPPFKRRKKLTSQRIKEMQFTSRRENIKIPTFWIGVIKKSILVPVPLLNLINIKSVATKKPCDALYNCIERMEIENR